MTVPAGYFDGLSARRRAVIFSISNGIASVEGEDVSRQEPVSALHIGDALGNAVAYWGVPDIEEAYRHFLDRGAAARQPVKDVGGDIKVATVADPFGNVIGLIQNPHFKME